MGTYLYKGMNNNGQTICGCENFSDIVKMEEFLGNYNMISYDIHPSSTKYTNKINKNVTYKEISVFCKQMSVVFFSDITLIEGVELIMAQTNSRELKLALEEMVNLMNKGYKFSEAIAMFTNIFSSYFINMVSIGELSGTLDAVFNELGNYYEKESKIHKKIRTALIYPLILIAMMTSIVILLVAEILPMFNDILTNMGGELPFITQILLNFGVSLQKYWYIFILLLSGFVISIFMYKKTPKGSLAIDKFKVESRLTRYIYSRIAVSRIAISLSILLRSGVHVLDGFNQVVKLLENEYLEKCLEQSIEKLQEGELLSNALKDISIFPPLFIKMIVIGERTGKLDEMMEKSSLIFDEEAEEAIIKLTSIIEPALIIILSIIVGVILVSIMLPMTKIMTTIG